MVERIITRTHRVEGDNLIAVKTDEWTNGVGKKVRQTVEEHNITEEDIDSVLNTGVQEEINKLQKDKEKLVEQIKELEDGIKDKINTREFKQFKEFINKEETKANFETLQKESEMEKKKKGLEELEKAGKDILAWEDQFKGLQKEL